MKILVLSDSHRDVWSLRRALEQEPNADLVIHLGDGADDMAQARDLIADRPVLQVRGNCDWSSTLPTRILTEEGGKRLLLTHGHEQKVKYGKYILQMTALENHADIALYGHTHHQVQDYEDGLYLCNPGSVRGGEYAVLEIVPQGVMWLQRKIRL